MASTKQATIEISKALMAALKYAVKVIDGYELEIRNSKETIGIDLIEKGFCQGEVYKKALDHIGDMLEKEAKGEEETKEEEG